MVSLNSARPAPLATVVARNTFLNSLRFGVVFVAGLATSVLLARALGPHDFGIYRLATGLLWGLEIVAVLAIPSAVTRFVAEAPRDDRERFSQVIGFHLLQTLVIYAVSLVLLLVFRDAVARFYREPALKGLLALGAVATLPGVVAGVLAAGLRGHQRFGELNALAVAQAVVGVAATALVLGLGGGVYGLFVLLIALNVVALGLASAVIRRDVLIGPLLGGTARELRSRMSRYGVVMGLVAMLGAVVWERSEIFFLGRWASAAEVGFYSLAYTLALQARRVVPTALGEVLFPVISRLEGVKDEWGIANASLASTRYLALVAFPMALGGVIFAAPVIRVLFGAAYLPAAPVLACLLVSAAVVALAQPAAAVIVSKERYRFLIVSSAFFTVLNLTLDVLLIPVWHAIGAAVANTVAQIAASVVQMIFVGRLLGVALPLGNLARCLAAALLAFAPAVALKSAGLAEKPVGLAVVVVAFVLLYPVLLARGGVLVPADFERLAGATQALPGPCHIVARRGIGVLRRLAR